MSVFTATFSAVSISAAQDVFELIAPSTSRLEILEAQLGQYSDSGDAQSELLGIQLIRGYTVAGSGGSAATPRNVKPWSRAAAATVNVNNTTVANTGTPHILESTSFNVQAGYVYRPTRKDILDSAELISVEASQIFVVRITAPADALTMNGTIKFREIGLLGQ
jgi:hypothetical protein